MKTDAFDGLATPGSAFWRINGEVVVLLGWCRAILLQLAHPLVAAGVGDHSHFRAGREARARRFRQTVATMLDLSFGTTEQALAAARRIDAIHGRVRGALRDPVEAFAPGTPYFARDPELLRWVHATLLDSFIRTYELFLEPLSPEDKDAYCAQTAVLAPMLGIPAGFLPASHAALLDCMRTMLANGQIEVCDTARDLAGHLFESPGPIVGDALMALIRLATAGLLPEPLRAAYGLPWDARRERALVLIASTCRIVLPRLPASVRRWPATRTAERRPAVQGI